MNELTGKTALVTGATSGIGEATARELAAQGATVIVHGRNIDRGERIAQEIIATGAQARFVAADLLDPDSVGKLIAEVGHVDILVNNAAIGYFLPTADLDRHSYDATFDANVRAAYLLVATLGPLMAERGDGAIVNVSSASGTIGQPVGAAYGASKAALNSLTRSWAAEFGPSGVRVNAVSPGPVVTSEAIRELAESFAPSIPLRRVAQPAEIASVIAFLAGPKASYINAATIPVDGGITAV